MCPGPTGLSRRWQCAGVRAAMAWKGGDMLAALHSSENLLSHSFGKLFFAAQEAEETSGQKGVTPVVDLCYGRLLL